VKLSSYLLLILCSLGLSVGVLHAGSAFDPALKKPVGLEAPDESKTLGTYIVPTKDSPKVPDLFFMNETGKIVRLSDFFDGTKPVVLNMVYIRCPFLCTEVLNGAVESMQKLTLTPGKDYKVLTVSFDPNEGGKYAFAASKKSSYIESFVANDKHGPRNLSDDAWSFFIEKEEAEEDGDRNKECDSKTLAEMLDFDYKFNEEKGMYEHPSMTIVLTPDGKISRYLYGTRYQAKDFKLAIIEAGKGKVGSSVERLISWCYRYDPKTNGYTPAVLRILSVTAAASLLLFGGFMFKMWRREIRNGSIK